MLNKAKEIIVTNLLLMEFWRKDGRINAIHGDQ